MRLSTHLREMLLLAALPLAFVLARGSSVQLTNPVSVGYGPAVPAVCQAGSPGLFVQRGSTGLVSINACTGTAYQQIWKAERFADAETPARIAEATDVEFKLGHVPNPANSLILTANGVTMRQGVDYKLGSQIITMIKAVSPAPAGTESDLLQAWYRY